MKATEGELDRMAWAYVQSHPKATGTQAVVQAWIAGYQASERETHNVIEAMRISLAEDIQTLNLAGEWRSSPEPSE